MNIFARIAMRSMAKYTELCSERPYGTIYTTIYAPGEDGANNGKKILVSTRTTCRPAEDYRIMETALELAQAVQLRHVDISPWQLFEHVVGYDYNEALRRRVEKEFV